MENYVVELLVENCVNRGCKFMPCSEASQVHESNIYDPNSLTPIVNPDMLLHYASNTRQCARVVLLGTYKVNIRGKRGVARRSLS